MEKLAHGAGCAGEPNPLLVARKGRELVWCPKTGHAPVAKSPVLPSGSLELCVHIPEVPSSDWNLLAKHCICRFM